MTYCATNLTHSLRLMELGAPLKKRRGGGQGEKGGVRNVRICTHLSRNLKKWFRFLGGRGEVILDAQLHYKKYKRWHKQIFQTLLFWPLAVKSPQPFPFSTEGW